ncbi:hyaluronidase 1-like [Centruroides sculpturatus]|uniref:hyaluronidase 1-like n=1 Tax=Centruroides sculpturatus TaxID=218467 RepID=UPI000C6D009E|nr:hyaluronidase 1-like [Centruroides sculpturatus]
MNAARVLAVALFWAALTVTGDFNVYWNAPSIMCSENFGVNVTRWLSAANVLVNRGERFNGDKIVLFYESQLGKYPYIHPIFGDVNGGLLRNADFSEHAKASRESIEKVIPNRNFRGIAVIDWESWRPIWETNWLDMTVYRNKSIELEKEKHPGWKLRDVRRMAKTSWEKYAKKWMLNTLKLAQSMRPHARWCYYNFPDCYHGVGENRSFPYLCSVGTRKSNNKLSWLWDQSSAICPSIYVRKYHVEEHDTLRRSWWTYSRLREAMRVSRNAPIYSYINYIFPGTNETLPKEDFKRLLGQIASLGLDGAIIWSSSFNMLSRELCQRMLKYVKETVIPAVSIVSWNVNRCSQTMCKGRGNCLWREDLFTSWKRLSDKKIQTFDRNKVVCKCRAFSGRYC